MKIAVEGCCHGELDKIYGRLQELEKTTNDKIDLVLICGDFQAIRNPADLKTMSVPAKYAKLGNFYEYYSGQKKAPYLTLFVGGNHEASNHLWELYHGGWVCENIYYLGAAGVVNYKGLRIGGISGIYKHFDYYKGHYERYPYSYSDQRSIYHVRDYEVQKLLRIQKPLDIMISHDWPAGIERCGNLDQLLRIKPFFKNDIDRHRLGNPAHTRLLKKLKPSRWFSAHLHVRYTAKIDNAAESNYLTKAKDDQTLNVTQFLALDKCLPNRQFLEIIDVPDSSSNSNEGLMYDLEWLAITRAMQPYLSLRPQAIPLPNDADLQSAIDQELMYLDMMLDTDEIDLTIPANFGMNVDTNSRFYTPSPNPQTVEFCKLLGIDDVIGNACPPPPRPTPDNKEQASSSTTDQPVLKEEHTEHKDETSKAPTTNASSDGQVLPPNQTAAAAGDVDKDQTTETQSHDGQPQPTKEQGDQSPKRQKLN
ncbi:lariat debranching enzyme [Lichtheimia corymbifera JMRC:FSU:9682]|uniref:Lariat debranching enzyme n=1 Tax=Lichtheimia corymbifera JMRC:FSU:9682 TaxID=1263082 RepID=A0A068S2A1_9FUNG|nr:lariat debranching enzyme [Lichtheimia corymbifera JMRC:FSU:9682]